MMGGDDDDGDAIAETQEISSENLFHQEVAQPIHISRHGCARGSQRLSLIPINLSRPIISTPLST
jgi:hypothetical protein